MAGELAYLLTLDNAGFKSAISDAMSSTEGMRGGMISLAATLDVAQKAWGAMNSVVSAFISPAAKMEQTNIAFKNLTGSAGLAKSMLKELQEFADESPFEDGPVIASGKALLIAGTAAQDVRRELAALGNVASATGVDLEGMTQAYAKAERAGKVMGDVLQQFSDQGVPAVKMLAASMHVAEADVAKLAEQGKISFMELRKAFLKTGEGSGEWAKAMAEQSHTTLGLWSTLSAAWDRIRRTIGEPINDAIRPFMQDIVDNWVPKFQGGLESAVITVKAALLDKRMGELVTLGLEVGAMKGLATIREGLSSLAGPVNGWIDGMAARLPSIGSMLAAMGLNFLEPFKLLGSGSFWEGVGGGIHSLFLHASAWAAELGSSVQDGLMEAFNNVRDFLGFDKIEIEPNALAEAAKDLATQANDAGEEAGEAFNQAIKGLQFRDLGLGEKVAEIVKDAGEAISGGGGLMEEKTNALAKLLKELHEGTGKQLEDAAKVVDMKDQKRAPVKPGPAPTAGQPQAPGGYTAGPPRRAGGEDADAPEGGKRARRPRKGHITSSSASESLVKQFKRQSKGDQLRSGGFQNWVGQSGLRTSQLRNMQPSGLGLGNGGVARQAAADKQSLELLARIARTGEETLRALKATNKPA